MTRHFASAAALALTTALAAGAASAQAEDGYTIGISNTVQGNGWREEMICAMKAQALASGEVEGLNIAHRNTDAAGQLEDLRNLIQAGRGRHRAQPPPTPRASTPPSRRPPTRASWSWPWTRR